MNYLFEYVNENDFRKKERSVKKYSMPAYKRLAFDYYPNLREGKFLGKLISSDNNIEKYELSLPTDATFLKVHGEITLHYSVLKDKNIILLENITPEDVLSSGHQSELTTYKGVMISKTYTEKDMFKINLLNMLDRR